VAIGAAQTVTYSLAFAAGVASLLSPCVLALLPVYVTYLSGVSAAERGNGGTRVRLVANALLFIAGFTLVFVALFGLTAAFVGKVLLRNQAALRQLSGLLVIAFGLHTGGLIRIPGLERDVRAKVQVPAAGPWRSFVIGMAFAGGWTPCVGPVLSAILVLSANADTVWQGVTQLLAYSLGMAVPFLLIALYLSRLRGILRWIQAHSMWVSRLTGLLLVVVGVMLYTNSFSRLASLFNYWKLLP